jgi:hypothetical protein
MIKRLVFLAGCVTLAASCSGSAPIPLEEFCARYAETLCAAAERCQCLSDVEIAYCPTYLAGECQDGVVAPVQSGQRAYDEAWAGTRAC